MSLATIVANSSDQIDISYESDWRLKQKKIVEHPRFMFHYSPRLNRESIEEHGLLIHPPHRGRIWDVQDPGVFLFADPIKAWDWQQDVHMNIKSFDPKTLIWDSEDDLGLDGDIWVVDTQELDTRYDVFLNRAICVSHDVDIQNITLTPDSVKRKLNKIYKAQEKRGCMTEYERKKILNMFYKLIQYRL